MKKVYLAGPDVFMSDACSRYAELKNICKIHGVLGVSPIESDCPPIEPDEVSTKKVNGVLDSARIKSLSEITTPVLASVSNSIYVNNVSLIHSCDGVIANLTPFRGAEPDSGTVFELAYAVAIGKPVIGYFDYDIQKYTDVVEKFHGEITKKPAPAILEKEVVGMVDYDVDGNYIEGFGLRCNLMLENSVLIVRGGKAEAILKIKELLLSQT